MNTQTPKERLGATEDPRGQWGSLRHKLEDILFIGLCSVICRGEDFVDMEDFGHDREEWPRGFLELPDGIPDSDTFRRVFERIDPNAFAECLNSLPRDIGRNGGRCVNIDGKTVRGGGNSEHSAYHAVSAWKPLI
ncbi:MAG: ISAs1 family transposase [Oscillospiraceae bacterium]|jgi:hypothetical protein|nr:ISAs1 family transposase [Oscillospiraceae bacterium]